MATVPMNASRAREVLAILSDMLHDADEEFDPGKRVAIIVDKALEDIDKLAYSMITLLRFDAFSSRGQETLETILNTGKAPDEGK